MTQIKLSHPLLLNPIALEQPSTKQENIKNLKFLVGFGQPILQIQSSSPNTQGGYSLHLLETTCI